jgi:hypothetical protein
MNMQIHGPDPLVADGRWLESLAPTSEMRELIVGFDWSSTSLGPPEEWSISLRSAVRLCLSSRFPMLVVWGPDLIKIYNDGYRPMLGADKHPRALGAPAREIWPEIWDRIGPMFDEVMTTGRPTWSEQEPLVLERNGYPEECYFTFSYSAVHDDDGSVGGVLDVVAEVTDSVVVHRRVECLTRLSTALVSAEQVTDVCVRAASALAGSTSDVQAADLYLVLDHEPTLVASNRRGAASSVDPDVVVAVARSSESVILGEATDGVQPAEHAVLPISGLSGGAVGALVISLDPRRGLDPGYRSFLHAVASTIGSALDNAYRRSDLLGQYQYVSDTLQRAMLTPVSSLPSLAARYLPAIDGLAVGGDWYDVIELDHDRRALIVGDCVGHGLDAATVMAQLRSAARAMLLDGRDPAEVLEGLDTFAASTGGAMCTTVACAVIDRNDDAVTYARAGHPPPLVVRADGAMWLDEAQGLPLAVDPGARRTSATMQLRWGDMLVMYSDGLTERRGETFDVGLERLRSSAQLRHGADVGAVADGLLKDLLPEGASDDVVLVVKSIPDRASDHPT